MTDPVELFSLHGKTAIVTGASSGIGRRIAESYAAAGATVYACARRADRLQELAEGNTPGRIIAHELDVTDSNAVRGLIERVEADKRIASILFHAAGLNIWKMPLSEDEFQTVVDVNLTGTWRMLTAGREHLQRAGHPGSFILISSISIGVTAASSGNNLAYQATKGGVAELVRWTASDYGNDDIRVNGIAPGWVRTEIIESVTFSDPAKMKILDDHTPLKRQGTTDDLVGTALFFASDASAWVTGTMLPVDGGISLGRLWNMR